jgi:glycerol-3-phosphate dehydrogenase
LAHTYGDRAFAVAKLAEMSGKRWPVLGRRLHSEFPYIQAEIRFAAREYAATAVDVIARRLRLAFLHTQVAEEVLPLVIDVMAKELGWSSKEKQAQHEKAIEYLRVEMGKNVDIDFKAKTPLALTKEEVNRHVKQFHTYDNSKRGYITLNDLRHCLKDEKISISDTQMHTLLTEVDISNNGRIELGEFLEFMYALRSGVIARQNVINAALADNSMYQKIPVERSGGGV